MEKTVPSRTQLMHFILHMSCVLCVVIVGVKPVAVYKDCPVLCTCSPDRLVPGAWALEADCLGVQEVPQLTANITHLVLNIASSIDGFALSSAPSLRRISIIAPSPITIHQDAFQSLSNLVMVEIIGTIPNLGSGLFKNVPSLKSLSLEALGLNRVPSETLCELRNIEHLLLENNDISSVSFDPCVLKAWPKISSLVLTHNPLESIQADDFYFLRDHNVTELFLDKCGLTSLPPGLFRYLPGLTRLDIRGNKIEFLPTGIFDYLSNLRDLSLCKNYLTSLSIHEDYRFMPVLRSFCLSDSISESSGSNVSFSRAFLSATSLDSLDISLMHTGDLDELFFANLIRSPVTTLTLSLSSVTWISSAAFDPLQSLQTLEFNSMPVEPEAMYNVSISLGRLPLQKLTINTKQKALDNQTFKGFLPNNNISYLDFSDNEIGSIGRNTFLYLNRVTTLKLLSNLLTNDGLEAGAFCGLYSLESLDLSNNKLRFMPKRIHLEIPATLRSLDLSGNNLFTLGYVRMSEWSNLKELYIQQNQITEDLSGRKFQGFSNLEILGLASNLLHDLSPDAFWGAPTLKTLYLDGNRVDKLPGGIFLKTHLLEVVDLQDNPLSSEATWCALLNLPSLKTLTLSDCEISGLQDEMFNKNIMLKRLILTGNFIISWQPQVFRPLPNLTDLILASNRIVDVPQSAFMYLTSLTFLDLSSNPLACTCKLLWFTHWITTSNVYLAGYTIKERYTCASPEQEKHTPLIDFQLTVDDCASRFLFNLVMGLVSGFLFVCTILSLAHRYRWYIRYYIFLVRSRRRQMYDALVEDETFRFDVYVCYHNTSRRWVINELLPRLEHEAGIKCCLHDRNWLAGPTIIDNIIESIEQSRKTLLLVNNEFAQSSWCREETSLAYHRLIETQRNMLIVVLLEDIKLENTDKILRTILTKRVYLKYSQSKKKEHRFWKALKAALRKGEDAAAGLELHRA